MKIRDFGVEIWMNRYENHCELNLAETCVQSLTVAELLEMAGKTETILDEILPMQLTYGAIEGSDRLRALVAGLWYLLIGGFVLIAAQSSYTAQLAKTAFEGKSVGAMMAREPITVSPDMTLAALVNQIMLRRAVSFLPVMEDGVLLGHIDQSVLSSIDRENWANTRVGDVFVGLEGGVMVDPDLALPDLLEIIRSTGRRKFMVVRDHELLGVITLSDLTRYLGNTLLPRPQQQEPRSS